MSCARSTSRCCATRSQTFRARKSRTPAMGCAAEVGDPALSFWAHNNEMQTCFERGDLERAKVALEQLQLIAHELDQPTMKWLTTYTTAGWELMHGDLVAAERLF